MTHYLDAISAVDFYADEDDREPEPEDEDTSEEDRHPESD